MRRIFYISFIITLSSIILSCGGGSKESSSIRTESYIGPGSTWTVDLSSNDQFSITYRENPQADVELSFSGNYQKLPSGFVAMTVTGSSDSGTVAGSMAFGLEVPGVMFLLQPVGGDGLVPMVSAGNCPNEDYVANWLAINLEDGADLTSIDVDLFGQLGFNTATGVASLTSSYNSAGTRRGSASSFRSGSCQDGILVIDDPVDSDNGDVLYLTDGGGSIIQTNIADDAASLFYFSLPVKSAGTLSGFQGEYVGLALNNGDPDGSQINAVNVSCSNAGVCQLKEVNPLTGVLSSDSATLTLSTPNSPTNGFIAAVMNIDTDNGNFYCMVDRDAAESGTKILMCTGQVPTDNSEYINLMLVSKN
ncbi:hypothetical protein [Pelagibaculum spongiae]|uniref:Uncharacterized protein n=1 Tax=Pelagibaculum spongiae TaxID=2080658 RepID=A0A2V1GYB1_9GAMM|nr:hypothetical protein [Pelagibaculum spongiae]PVZ67654.1 hypothetical protein DC094_14550 [Pelagibaculum spongiae]